MKSQTKVLFLFILAGTLLTGCGKTGKTVSELDLPFQLLRIGIFVKYPLRQVEIDSPSWILQSEGIEHRMEGPAVLHARGDDLFLSLLRKEEGREWHLSRATLHSTNSPFRISTEWTRDRTYTGDLEISSRGGRLTVVEIVRQNDYVRDAALAELGNLLAGSDLSGNRAMELLAAQEVTIRSYLYGEPSRHTKEGYHFCDLAHCIHYRGHPEHLPGSLTEEIVHRATKETRNLVLADPSTERVLPGFFHSSCGGRAAPPPESFSGGLYRSGEDRFHGKGKILCRNSPDFRWNAFLLREAFPAHSIEATPLPGSPIRLQKMDGRVRNLEWNGMDGKLHRIPDADFRRGEVMRRLLRSDAYRIHETTGPGVLFQGQGRGHGIGLCQWGARQLAVEGKDSREILKHYFPKATLYRGREASP